MLTTSQKATQTFVYDTYIRTTPEKLWEALTSGDFSEQYWMGFRISIEPRAGGKMSIRPPKGHEAAGDHAGKVLAWDPPRKLSYEFVVPCKSENDGRREGHSYVTFELKPMGEMVKLRVLHENLLAEDIVKDPSTLRGINNGWPAVISSLKSLLETGKPIVVPLPEHK
ncbi:MAG TPA: SRPBCC family protein [Elusimicrobiota bacterium]|nr:SRPBCC family protein [Elusimicrobiota bacterium]